MSSQEPDANQLAGIATGPLTEFQTASPGHTLIQGHRPWDRRGPPVATGGPLRLRYTGLASDPVLLDLPGQVPHGPGGKGELCAVGVLRVADTNSAVGPSDLDTLTALAGTATGLAPFQAWVIKHG